MPTPWTSTTVDARRKAASITDHDSNFYGIPSGMMVRQMSVPVRAHKNTGIRSDTNECAADIPGSSTTTHTWNAPPLTPTARLPPENTARVTGSRTVNASTKDDSKLEDVLAWFDTGGTAGNSKDPDCGIHDSVPPSNTPGKYKVYDSAAGDYTSPGVSPGVSPEVSPIPAAKRTGECNAAVTECNDAAIIASEKVSVAAKVTGECNAVINECKNTAIAAIKESVAQPSVCTRLTPTETEITTNVPQRSPRTKYNPPMRASQSKSTSAPFVVAADHDASGKRAMRPPSSPDAPIKSDDPPIKATAFSESIQVDAKEGACHPTESMAPEIKIWSRDRDYVTFEVAWRSALDGPALNLTDDATVQRIADLERFLDQGLETSADAAIEYGPDNVNHMGAIKALIKETKSLLDTLKFEKIQKETKSLLDVLKFENIG